MAFGVTSVTAKWLRMTVRDACVGTARCVCVLVVLQSWAELCQEQAIHLMRECSAFGRLTVCGRIGWFALAGIRHTDAEFAGCCFWPVPNLTLEIGSAVCTVEGAT